jgi:hypothetical protein
VLTLTAAVHLLWAQVSATAVRWTAPNCASQGQTRLQLWCNSRRSLCLLRVSGSNSRFRRIKTSTWLIPLYLVFSGEPIPVAVQSKAWVLGRSLAGIVGSNPAVCMDVCYECCVCCQVEVSATSWSLVQRSPTECGVPECDREASTVRRPWPTRAVAPWWGGIVVLWRWGTLSSLGVMSCFPPSHSSCYRPNTFRKSSCTVRLLF